ncbi:MAG TPA: alpha/beta fold hydrolase [Longimicrobiales bacterium]|nr:alpha/beta fold hydrolase [Longimicrobiales bacterium]
MIVPEIRHDRIAGDGVTLHVARAGAGPPVLLLHGFPENWQTWQHQMGPLAAAGLEVLAPDLRGYHLSDRPAGRAAYRLRHLVADAAALIRATPHGRAHVVGHDWGGSIAWSLAAEHPELVDRLVIMNAPHLGTYLREVRRPPQLLRSWYVGFFQLPMLPERMLAAHDFRVIRRLFRGTARPGVYDEAQIERYVQALAQPGALTAALNYYRALGGRDLARARRARTEADTLVIWGERDRALSTRLLDGLEAYAPRLRVRRLPNASHWVQHDAPAEVSRALVAFLAG